MRNYNAVTGNHEITTVHYDYILKSYEKGGRQVSSSLFLPYVLESKLDADCLRNVMSINVKDAKVYTFNSEFFDILNAKKFCLLVTPGPHLSITPTDPNVSYDVIVPLSVLLGPMKLDFDIDILYIYNTNYPTDKLENLQYTLMDFLRKHKVKKLILEVNPCLAEGLPYTVKSELNIDLYYVANCLAEDPIIYSLGIYNTSKEGGQTTGRFNLLKGTRFDLCSLYFYQDDAYCRFLPIAENKGENYYSVIYNYSHISKTGLLYKNYFNMMNLVDYIESL